jgi:hypothetical protein
MYLKRFWLKDYQDHEINGINFTHDDDQLSRWSVIPAVAASDYLLILRLISVGLRGGQEFLHSIGPALANRWIQGNKPIFWGVDFLNDKFKNYRIQYKTYPDGHTPPPLTQNPSKNDISIFPGFCDHKKPLGSFAYSYNPTNSNFTALEPEPDFTPRRRSARFASMFAQHFVLTPVDEWLYRQYRNATQYQSKKAECIYDSVD